MLNRDTILNWHHNLSFFADRGIAHSVAYGRWRLNRWMQKRASRSFAVDSAGLLTSLRPGVIPQPDSTPTLLHLGGHFKTRTNPTFFFSSRDMELISAKVSQEEKQTTIHAADQILQDLFEFRGSESVRFENEIDWQYAPNGNLDWRWDLNRHSFFVTLGRAYVYTKDERYPIKFVELLEHWRKRNPAQTDHANWSSVFEIACRANNWMWALYYMRYAQAFSPEWCNELIAGLLEHGRYLDANLELHVPNNHLLLEAKALAFLGILLPEFKEAGRWRERGLELVEGQVLSQVSEDGVHGERTTLYHRVITGELLELLVLMENNRIPISRALLKRFSRMVDFEAALQRPDGTFPLLGDSAAADTLLRFSALNAGRVFLSHYGLGDEPGTWGEADYWLMGTERRPRRVLGTRSVERPSRDFPLGGYYIMHDGKGHDANHLVFDCGAFGLKAMPNHGHADALSLELYAGGETLLVDPGVYSTALGLEWRNFFRGTSGHNTVVVDGADQSYLMDARRVYRPAQATCLTWITNDRFDFVDGVHDGYEHLPEPVTHRRQILFAKSTYWVVVDTLAGTGMHTFDLYWHMLPKAQVTMDPLTMQFSVENPSGAGIAIAPLIESQWDWHVMTGVTDPIQGWVSTYSGEKQPAPVLRIRQAAHAPVRFCTILYPFCVGSKPTIKITQLSREKANVICLRIETPRTMDYMTIDSSPVTSKIALNQETRVAFKRVNRNMPLATNRIKV